MGQKTFVRYPLSVSHRDMARIKRHRPRKSNDGHKFIIDLYDKDKITCSKCGLEGYINYEKINSEGDRRAEITWTLRLEGGRRPGCKEYIMRKALI
jgi:hypothetical protein